jgi:hypothetical protein
MEPQLFSILPISVPSEEHLQDRLLSDVLPLSVIGKKKQETKDLFVPTSDVLMGTGLPVARNKRAISSTRWAISGLAPRWAFDSCLQITSDQRRRRAPRLLLGLLLPQSLLP